MQRFKFFILILLLCASPLVAQDEDYPTIWVPLDSVRQIVHNLSRYGVYGQGEDAEECEVAPKLELLWEFQQFEWDSLGFRKEPHGQWVEVEIGGYTDPWCYFRWHDVHNFPDSVWVPEKEEGEMKEETIEDEKAPIKQGFWLRLLGRAQGIDTMSGIVLECWWPDRDSWPDSVFVLRQSERKEGER